MNRRFRLRKNADFQRVRREGRAYAHPLVVLIVAPNELAQVRVGVAAGRSVGKAVQRNKAKRRLREIMRPLIPQIAPGHDLMLIARKPMIEADFAEVRRAVLTLLRRADLLQPGQDPLPPDDTPPSASAA
ncbi:MAG: ribonuclease P protein component [Chloroflexi bacterium]|nr:ribonuclease P protein component [Chloroflexota bacterium]